MSITNVRYHVGIIEIFAGYRHLFGRRGPASRNAKFERASDAISSAKLPIAAVEHSQGAAAILSEVAAAVPAVTSLSRRRGGNGRSGSPRRSDDDRFAIVKCVRV
ncbi:hypothetical protein EVAR_61954_1 [Eumeta japonica]|uniref:Uncharacterized protein n=1 Tax=Eumeta variegata TaxID=151549 RepID=A0A4C1ZMP7_EUMVA|nr:hypothetical protein EVAR_61954_1 [Eumeta japonica]